MMEKMKFARDWLNDPTKDPHGIGRSPILLFSCSLKASRLPMNMDMWYKLSKKKKKDAKYLAFDH